MSRTANSECDTDPIPRVDGPRHRLPSRRDRRWGRAARRVLAGLAAVAVLAVTAVGWAGYRNLSGGITTSQALAGGPASVGGAQNILIMGLDSRLDQHGQPLPQDIYDALHAGDETVGGYNANVLILLHLPGGNGPVSAVSVPRDDYVDLPGCPSGVCKGKIKQAYGLAYQQTLNSLSDSIAESTREQTAREAGRRAEIDTMRRLLGVPIDHFIEVTLGAFFQIAQVVQPITVCLNNDTSDSYSGADFHRGVQQIDAAQAMAFVRQRRDENDQMFTDLDRTRRQQAFIVSLVTALRHGGALSSPSDLRNLLRVAQQNIAVDAGFDLASFVDHAATLTDSALTLYTLPISEFGQDAQGEDVNMIDVAGVRAIVHSLFTNGSTPQTPTLTQSPSVPTTLDIVNATNHDGLGSAVEQSFGVDGLTTGTVTTADGLADASTIAYGPGADDAAHMLANRLQLTATASDAVAADTVQLTIGADFPADQYLTSSSTAAVATPVTTVDATATGTKAPAPTDLTEMAGTNTPCVK
ncbi:MAG: cell envelope-related function transcriptional attenuator common domain protein [Mycobacterium sp.]|nr:cell envelope-related function transcriptional attenuator common domain protein [Mycobacterium sp.]